MSYNNELFSSFYKTVFMKIKKSVDKIMSPCFTFEGCVAVIYIYTAVQAAYVERSGSVDETLRPRSTLFFIHRINYPSK